MTWEILPRTHYVFLAVNVVMWVSLIVANQRDPGFLAKNTGEYHRWDETKGELILGGKSASRKFRIPGPSSRSPITTSGRGSGGATSSGCATLAGLTWLCLAHNFFGDVVEFPYK